VFRLSTGSKNNHTPEKMLMYEVFSLLLCDMRRNVSARSVTIDTVRLLKNQIKTKLDKSKLAREESGASADDCSACRMLNGVANADEKSRSVNGVDEGGDEDDVDLDAEMSAIIQLDDLMSAEDAMNNMQFSEGNDDIAADNDAENVDEVVDRGQSLTRNRVLNA
jgi:hypothetical protein